MPRIPRIFAPSCPLPAREMAVDPRRPDPGSRGHFGWERHGRSVPRGALAWGVVAGIATAAAPLAFWWLPAASVYSMGLVLIAAVYIGFAVADGQRHVIVVETATAAAFVLVAAFATTGSAWLLVAGLVGHGVKDLWQHRTGFVANTRWWPSFCVTVDWVAAVLLAVVISAGHPLR
jgi:hypothetical protein